jgi:hypothetical protein
MRRLDRTLSHGVRHEEEVKLAIDHLRLLNKACVHVGSLRRIVDEVLSVVTCSLLEESLADSLVHDDQGNFRMLFGLSLRVTAVLHGDDAVELLKLLVDDLLSHRVTDAITVDEHMAGQYAIVELTVGFEASSEVI